MQRTVLTLALAVALPAAAQQYQQHDSLHGARHMRMRHHAMPMMIQIHGYAPQRLLRQGEALALTEQQVERLTQLRDETRRERDAARQAADGHFQQAEAAWNAGDGDGAATHARLGLESMQQAHLGMLAAAAAARAVLTEEQRARVAGWTDAMRMRHGRGMRGRPGRRQHGR